MANNIIERLEWDSKFFGYPVARIIFDGKEFNHAEYVLQQLISEKIRLTYLFVPESETKLGCWIENIGGIPVDKKVVFHKTTEKQMQFSNNIVEFRRTDINKDLINLVLQAGEYSRFHSDVNFSNGEYEKLYIEWLTKSLNKELALKTFVAMKNTDFIGITTLGEKLKTAEIGLVAVDEKFRGQRIGSDLIRFADNAAKDIGYNEIKVVTQLKNKQACRLYEKCNFKIESITNVYHFWQ
jgi:dTDP-4-amino-4,6-dideoxy-D-galactose acyltransferase